CRRYAEHLEQLKKDWALKNDDDHPRARQFTKDTWAQLESAAQLKANMEQAKESLRTFQKVGDKLSPLILLKANTGHALRLTKRLEALLASANAEDRTEANTMGEVGEDLNQLPTGPSTCLGGKKQRGPAASRGSEAASQTGERPSSPAGRALLTRYCEAPR